MTLKIKFVVSLGILSSSMTDDIYGLAEAMALSELKWTLPIDEVVDPFKNDLDGETSQTTCC